MARVGVDCDGVLANFAAAFIEILRKIKPDNPLTEENWTSWNYGGHVSNRLVKKVWAQIKATPNFWTGVPAYESNVRALAQWLATQTAQDVWIVTSRAATLGLSAAAQTQLWLDACGVRPFYNYLGIITVPYPEDKMDVLSRLDIRWMIDDKSDTIEGMDVYPYMHAALLDRPWNQDARPKWRAKSVAEFLAVVKG